MNRNQTFPIKNQDHAWPLSAFEDFRKHLVSFLKDNVIPALSNYKTILIQAPVKSGKREMPEYLAMRDYCPTPNILHVFISAWYRVSDENQRKELKNHNIKVFSIITLKDVNDCIEWITKNMSKTIICHFDECDFGSGARQSLAKIYSFIRILENIKSILYSATPEEYLFSDEHPDRDVIREIRDDILNNGIAYKYIPEGTFCGPLKFLEENLVKDAIPFYYKNSDNSISLSDQGKEIIDLLWSNSRSGNSCNMVTLRLCYYNKGVRNGRNRKDNKAIYEFIKYAHTAPELRDVIIIADKECGSIPSNSNNVDSRKIDWSNPNFWRSLTDRVPIIILLDQTCSRSTELACHHRLGAIHEYRHNVQYCASSQALERVNHYCTKYNGIFQKIHIYGHKKTLELSAGLITYSEYLREPEWKMKKIHNQNNYHIRSRIDNRIHPEYSTPMNLEEVTKKLQLIGCYVQTEMSQRIDSSSKDRVVYDSVYIPCTKSTFEQVVLSHPIVSTYSQGRRQNPFETSERKGLVNGKYQGYLREWKVFDYDRDIVDRAGWGFTGNDDNGRFTICYRNNELGVAFRYNTGRRTLTTTINTNKTSMYNISTSN
jgi:hypothetical protein